MVYFFHHFELPVIIQQAQLQDIMSRNRTNARQPNGSNTSQNLRHIEHPRRRAWFLQFRQRNISNDSNNNMSQSQITQRLQVAEANNRTSRTDGFSSRQEHVDASLIDTHSSLMNIESRSNFQRNFEENNFLFSSDIERSETVSVNHQSQQFEMLYSIVPFPRQDEFTQQQNLSTIDIHFNQQGEPNQNLLRNHFPEDDVRPNSSDVFQRRLSGTLTIENETIETNSEEIPSEG